MMALCLVEIALNLPILIVVQILAIPGFKQHFRPYTSWADIHYGFNEVVKYPASIFDQPGGQRSFASQALGRWVAPISAYLMFL